MPPLYTDRYKYTKGGIIMWDGGMPALWTAAFEKRISRVIAWSDCMECFSEFSGGLFVSMNFSTINF